MDGVFKDEKSHTYSVDDKGYVQKRPLDFDGRAKRLTEFADEYAFFTPAVPYLWGQFRDIILVDYFNLNRVVDFGFYRFRHPIFIGLHTSQSRDWNHALWAVPKDAWDSVRDHICAAMTTDQRGQHLYKYSYQEFDIPDPLYLERTMVMSNSLPMITIGAFAVRSEAWQAAFDFEGDPLTDPPRLRFYEPDEECRLYAQALFHGLDPQEVVHRMKLAKAQTKELLRGDPPRHPSGDPGEGRE